MSAVGQPQEGEIDVIPSGIPGLDHVLRGGLPRGQLYIVEGDAGAGKTTLGLQFLLEGKRRGEKTLWCTLSETEQQIQLGARSHGWDLAGIEVCNLAQVVPGLAEDSSYSFFSPADIELSDITRAILEAVRRTDPQRVVFDPFSDVKFLARDPLRYRRQVLVLREFFTARGCTVLLIQERTADTPADMAVEGVVQGMIRLYQHAPAYGRQRRRLRVQKLRGVNFRDGFHDAAIHKGGLVVYPHLVASEHALPMRDEQISSDIAELDAMLGGGLHRGSSLLILGPAGVGKSTLGTQFALAAIRRGERAAVFLFDETERAFLKRGAGLHLQLQEKIDAGLLALHQIDPTAFSPGEFAHLVCQSVEESGVGLVLIDSLNGYLSGMPEEQHLSLHLHELLTYLSYRNVVTVLIMSQHGFLGEALQSPADVSYLADSGILLRYFEAFGKVRRAISILKCRVGPHEVQIREMNIGSIPGQPAVQVGEALSEFQGVLTGQPRYTGAQGGLSGVSGAAAGGQP